jgi:excinuclease UvrABC nuclease subunit
MVARVTRIEAVTCDSPHEAALLERNLLEASLPP